MIALLGGLYDGRYAAVADLPPHSIIHITAGSRSETYRVLPGGIAEVTDEDGPITVALKPQYVCVQHTFPTGLRDGTRTPPGGIR